MNKLFSVLVLVLCLVPTAYAQEGYDGPFFCSGDSCFPEQSLCERYVRGSRGLGVTSPNCRRVSRMVCFHYYDAVSGEGYSQCYRTARSCTVELDRFRQTNAWSESQGSESAYTLIGECNTKQSRRRAPEVATAPTRSAQYHRITENRRADLVNLVAVGAVINRSIYCNNETCDFTPSAGSEVMLAHCLAGVNPDGTIGFACFPSRNLCINMLGLLNRNPEMDLELTTSCFTASYGRSGQNFYRINSSGEEIL